VAAAHLTALAAGIGGDPYIVPDVNIESKGPV
jgi:hypothetical protein